MFFRYQSFRDSSSFLEDKKAEDDEAYCPDTFVTPEDDILRTVEREDWYKVSE